MKKGASQMKKNKNKILHIFNNAFPYFSGNFIAMLDELNNNPSAEHFVLIRNKEQYDKLLDKTHVLLDEQPGILTTKYINTYDYLFIHSLLDISELKGLASSQLKRIIWRTWGSDSQFLINRPTILHPIRFIRFKRMLSPIKHLRTIGISTETDALIFRSLVAPSKIRQMNYPQSDHEVVVNEKPKCERIKAVMVGHSGFENDNHSLMIKAILGNPNLQSASIYVPVAYGNRSYISALQHEFSGVPNIHFITEMFSFEQWVQFLSSIDIAILDGMGSYALGNIRILLKMRSAIVLNGKGFLARSFRKEGIPFLTTDRLSTLNLDSLPSDFQNNGENSSFVYKPRSRIIKEWKLLTESLIQG